TRERLARVRRAQEHLLALINDILSFARLEAGHVEIVSTDITVASLLAELGTFLQPQAATRGLALVIDAGPPELSIHADRERVLQVLLNLGTNALKFTSRGEIRIVAREEEAGMVSLHVSDSGIGIAADRLSAIFDPFTQVHGTVAEREGGVGLGLAISRELAQRMGGALTVESTQQQGSRFTMLLPRGARRSE
ncbi:MAG TPA: ATP-binding protein, partial [Gemmatimonadaceae bacterium]|nr:ATP-binding protein [Gemmatimonadaceae bacterium]